MTNKIEHKLYNGEITLFFYPDSHRYKLEGEKTWLLGTTSITGIIDKSRALIPWAVNTDIGYIQDYLAKQEGKTFTSFEFYQVLEEAKNQHNIKKTEAADLGTLVHNWAEQFILSIMKKEDVKEVDLNDPIYKDVDKNLLLNGINAFIEWYTKNDVVFKESELLLYSKKYGYAGITDCVANINGKDYIIDFKTSKGVYNEMHYQISAYWGAYNEEKDEKVSNAMILHFNKETGDFAEIMISEEELKENFKAFLGCLAIKNREKELNKGKKWYK